MSEIFLFSGVEQLGGVSCLPQDICIQNYGLTVNISNETRPGGPVSRVHAPDVLMPEREAAGPGSLLSSLRRKASDAEQQQKSWLVCCD